MPVNRKEMKSLKDQYGAKKGESIYYALENKRKSKPKRGERAAKVKKGSK